MTPHERIVLYGSPVYTVDPAQPWAEAVYIADGRIVAVGGRDEIEEILRPGTRRIEIENGLILPGFQDAHVHPLHGGLSQFRCNLHDLSGKDAYLEAIAAYAKANPDEEWIRGDGWAMDAFPGGTPHRDDLDRVVPDRPVFLVNRDGHGAWVNSKALELAGIDAKTGDPIDGRLERDEKGPTGTLHEGAMALVERLLPANTQDDLVRALYFAQHEMHRLGITAWQDAWVTTSDLEAYWRVQSTGELTARIVLSLLWERDKEEEQIERLMEERRAMTGRIKANTVKIFQDGVAENFTAALTEPYIDPSGGDLGSGLSLIDPELLKRYVTALDRERFQVHFHAIGDRAVRESLDAVEAAREANGINDHRHHIAHIQLIHPDDLGRFSNLGVVANGQPYWACRDAQMTDLTLPFFGPQRAEWQYPFASLLRAGAPLAFGSDWPVSTVDPLPQIEVATTRTPVDDRDAEPLNENERVSVEEAITAFTMGAAYVSHLEYWTGSLARGKLADITVLDRNILDGSDEPVSDARVLLTMVEGDLVYAEEGVAPSKR
jgi:predicted amidohydrolase YtcJ